MNILNVERVSKIYGEKELFRSITLGINKGDKIGLIGVNGTGKSSLLKIVAGLDEPDEGKIVKGSGVTVSYLAQSPDFQDNETVIEYVLRGKQHASVAEAKEILNKLDVGLFDMPMSILSGGQKKRVALAKTLVEPAEVLILDEPTNHLDNNMIEWLENYIKGFKGELLMVTHDRYFLDNVTNRIVELDHGSLYGYDTNYSGFLELKTQREQMERATEAKRQNILRKELAWIRRGCQARSTKQQARIDRYEDMKEASREARQKFEKDELSMGSVSTRLGKKTIELNGICKKYGETTYINDFTYIFLRDDRIGIVGQNGCGKSTLMKIITGQEQPDSGSVETGETVRIGYFMQENEPLDDNQTVLEFVRSIGEYVNTVDGKATASQMCEKFLFGPKQQWTPIRKLSGGEKRRLYLLSVLMSSPNVLILDEPTNDLDIETLEILEDYLDGFAGIIITVSHDRYFLDRVVDRIFAFESNGHIKQYEGGYSDYKEKCVSSILYGNTPENSIRAKDSGTETDKPKGKTAYVKDRSNQIKFTYAEQKEYESIDTDIENLESEISRLDDDIAECATQYSKLNDLMKQKALLEQQLELKMERWVYLNDLAEKIALSKA
ncbi:MAG: ABC-F family ATP-binding cassette domain-containing protein [Lachnospira sp.]